MHQNLRNLPNHSTRYIGDNQLYLECYECKVEDNETKKRPILLVHGAYTGSWMWCKYIPHIIAKCHSCYVLNLRGHYLSRSVDLTKVTFEDYLDDIREVIDRIGETPIIYGFSMGGILTQKLAEEYRFPAMVLLDSTIPREVISRYPYEVQVEVNDLILEAPDRKYDGIDESREDIDFQRMYLSMESSRALAACSCSIRGSKGISIDSNLVDSPTLVIKVVDSENDDKQGKAIAEHFGGDYLGLRGRTHTSILVGQRYQEVVEFTLKWLDEKLKYS